MILQRPEDVQIILPVFHSASCCAGAVSSFLLRRIAYRAGSYAPGLQENLFHELVTYGAGSSLDAVNEWFATRKSALHELGYLIHSRRATERTPAILDWIKEGKGFRGAVLPTDYHRLHRQSADAVSHAVGLTVDRIEASSSEELVMIDPWPGTGNGTRDRTQIPATLEAAHRSCNYQAIIFFWSGWS